MPVAKIPRIQIDTLWVERWQPELIGTLMFVLRTHQARAQVLLIHKKTGHGQGRVNGPGGKLDAGESLTACATREVLEEVGLQVANPVCRAELRFVELDGSQWLGYAYTADQFGGQLIETPEAKPFWCDIEEIPFADMWPDDQIWLPTILQQHASQSIGKSLDQKSGDKHQPLVGDFLFENEQLLEHRVYKDKTFSVSLDTVLDNT
ncbi:MAG: 8-oxo-dGTP diphosphatase [Candidatus Azotimanducaceae bacterium]|jgi:8-oxo-dGTP diphosphatase|tara:strand:+ start:3076 stop:3693 length:618 start_codon:yes stop_codon:yes gene_type:complete